MPTGMSGLFRNTYGARAERGHDMLAEEVGAALRGAAVRWI